MDPARDEVLAAVLDALPIKLTAFDGHLRLLWANAEATAVLRSGVGDPRARLNQARACVQEARDTLRLAVLSLDDGGRLECDIEAVARRSLMEATRPLGVIGLLRFVGTDRMVSFGLASDVTAVVREAVSNAARHGRAQHVEMRLDLSADRLRLRIRDDGVGMRAPTRTSGLRHMADRAARHGGRLSIPAVAHGTEIEWEAILVTSSAATPDA